MDSEQFFSFCNNQILGNAVDKMNAFASDMNNKEQPVQENINVQKAGDIAKVTSIPTNKQFSLDTYKMQELVSYNFTPVFKKTQAKLHQDAITDFWEFFKEGGYVLLDDILSTYNFNFVNGPVETEMQALLAFITIKYNIQLTEKSFTELCDYYQYQDLLLLQNNYRYYTDSEIHQILVCKEQTWFDVNILRWFSLEERDTFMLLTLMQRNVLDIDELCKYAYNNNILNAYLLLKMEDKYTSEFDSFLLTQNDINSYLDVMLKDSENSGVSDNLSKSLLCIACHQDFNEIYKFIQNNVDIFTNFDLLEKYKEHTCLLQIVKLYNAGLYNEDLVEFISQLNIEDELRQHIFIDLTEHPLNMNYVKSFKGKYYLCKIFSDMDSLNLPLYDLEKCLHDKDKILAINQCSMYLYNAMYAGLISDIDVKQFLFLLADDSTASIAKCINEYFIKPLSFNQFWINYFLNKLYRTSAVYSVIPKDVGDLILIGNSEECSYFNILDVIIHSHDLILSCDAVAKGNQLQIDILEDNFGIKIYPINDICMYNVNLLDYHCRNNNSLSNMINTGYVSSNFNYNTTKFRYNLTNLLNNTEYYSDKINKFLSCKLSEYLAYDKIFSEISNNLTEYTDIVRSNNCVVYLEVLNRLMHLKYRGNLIFNFLNTILKACFHDIVKTSVTLPDGAVGKDIAVNIQEVSIINVEGLIGFSEMSIRNLIKHLDEILYRMKQFTSIELIYDMTMNHITVRGWKD